MPDQNADNEPTVEEADEYQADAIASANSMMPDDEVEE